VGTTHGRLLTFKILPQPNGGFKCEFAGATKAEGRIVSITPLNADSGKRAWATQKAMSNLREGIKVPGILVLVTNSEARIFKPPGAKGAHKSWDEYNCVSAAVAELEDYGICLSCVMDTGAIKSYSLPGLKEIANVNIKGIFDPARLNDTRILDTGHILGWTAQTEFMFVYMWGKGQRLDKLPPDTLYNPNTPVPARPTISNVQWISGTQYVTAADVDLLSMSLYLSLLKGSLLKHHTTSWRTRPTNVNEDDGASQRRRASSSSRCTCSERESWW
jgi:hypothetical protein